MCFVGGGDGYVACSALLCLQRFPVLPGKGDMSFRPEFVIKRTPLFDPELAAEIMGYDADIAKAEVRCLFVGCVPGTVSLHRFCPEHDGTYPQVCLSWNAVVANTDSLPLVNWLPALPTVCYPVAQGGAVFGQPLGYHAGGVLRVRGPVVCPSQPGTSLELGTTHPCAHQRGPFSDGVLFVSLSVWNCMTCAPRWCAPPPPAVACELRRDGHPVHAR